MKILTPLAVIFALLLPTIQAVAQTKGRVTGHPIPRFASLKSSHVNLRVGPDKKFAVQWRYVKAGLPVEIIQEFEQWRRIRDSQGTEGWVFFSLLSGKRTAIITPWEKNVSPEQTDKFIRAYNSESTNASVAARLQPGVVVKIRGCGKTWCEISTGDVTGHVQKVQLWGVYPEEIIDK